MKSLTVARARRIALASQGFRDPQPSGRVDVRHFRRVLDRIGLLQLESVNVAVRSHYMPVFSRLGSYQQKHLDRFAYDRGELFEYWGHEASLLPIDTYPLFRHRMEQRHPWKHVQALFDEHPGFVQTILDVVRERGPISISDLDEEEGRTGPWWGYSQGKLALEWLFASGQIGCSHRENFKRYYDIPERIFPPELLATPGWSKEHAHREMLLRAVRHHGVGTLADLADYYRISVPEARPRVGELVEQGLIEEVMVTGWRDTAYLDPAAATPRAIGARALLTPFDPVVWHRPRTERLFGFRYRIEIYVPAAAREYGYYVYPFLLDDRLVGRVDLKADRQAGVLRAQASFVEDGHDPIRVGREMGIELNAMAEWLGLDGVEVMERGNLASRLGKSI